MPSPSIILGAAPSILRRLFSSFNLWPASICGDPFSLNFGPSPAYRSSSPFTHRHGRRRLPSTWTLSNDSFSWPIFFLSAEFSVRFPFLGMSIHRTPPLFFLDSFNISPGRWRRRYPRSRHTGCCSSFGRLFRVCSLLFVTLIAFSRLSSCPDAAHWISGTMRQALGRMA